MGSESGNSKRSRESIEFSEKMRNLLNEGYWLVSRNVVHKYNIEQYWESLKGTSAAYCSFCRDGFSIKEDDLITERWADTGELIRKSSSKYKEENIGRTWVVLIKGEDWLKDELEHYYHCRGEKELNMFQFFADIMNAGFHPADLWPFLRNYDLPKHYRKVIENYEAKEQSNRS